MNTKTLFSHYLKNLTEAALRGDAREESFYPPLKVMLEQTAHDSGRTHVHVTPQPTSTEAGNPDFRVWNGTDRIIGYIEAKKPTEESLNHIEDSEQLQRYRDTFPNLILTNFLEFRLYRDGQCVETVLAARPYVLNRLDMTPPVEKPDELRALLDRFFDFSLPKAYSAETLAVALAKRTRFLSDVVAYLLGEERDGSVGMLHGFYEAFQKFLIGALTPEDFADLYAQTITYGLFAARTRAGDSFSRRAAFDNIPHTIGVLRDLFRFISLGELPHQLEWIVDDISEVLAAADATGILDRYYHEGKGLDPIVHFYETFLARYDPEERERRGVYYTPEPVVSYIVRSLHHILKESFGMADGLASEGVTLLDPAAGTMTFVARAAQEAVREFEDKYGSGGREEFIRTRILPNFYAFELMMAPYAVGHLKMSFFLDELGHRLTDDERVRFYLTNTLEMEEMAQTEMPFYRSLAHESRLAGEVKRQTPVLVILGNPPYSGHSVNRGEWILSKIDDYKTVDGKPLGEKNPKWLQDDYVKFLRFAQWKIEQAGHGVVGMITNHSYLDNPTFRGMRRSLMKTFDEIHVLDLHGNALKRETCPDGSKDENVFDIRQGVAIAFFVKISSPNLDGSSSLPAEKTNESMLSPSPFTERGPGGEVYHADVWGVRQQKYDWLNGHEKNSTGWTKITPKPEFYLFSPRDEVLLERFEKFTKVTEIMPVNSVGIVTARDHLTIQASPDDVWRTVTLFSRMETELARETFKLGKDVRDWKVTFAQKDLLDSGPSRNNVAPVLYRPFDVRYTYYTGNSRGFICMPRPEIMHHMLAGDNIALITNRQVAISGIHHAFVCDQPVDLHILETAHASAYVFPLYLYPPTDRHDLFSQHEISERKPNLNPEIIERLERSWSARFVPHPLTPSPQAERGNKRTPLSPSPCTERGPGGEVPWRTPPHLWDKLKPLAREMRHDPTPEEDILWQQLRNRAILGFKFRRQHPIDRFIVDFYCAEASLVIEVEGPIHDYTQEEDAIRREFLESLGLQVLRFTNDEINTAPDTAAKKIASVLSEVKRIFTPEDIFYYIYAVLYSPSYRGKYAEFLRIDFPRIPFAADYEVFWDLAALGERLAGLHLLKSPELDTPSARFEGDGDNRVAKNMSQGFRYEAEESRAFINRTQHFAPVRPEVWNYRVGGYQVCEKWLKDRRGRKLELEDIRAYCRIVTALGLTIGIQKEIDTLYREVEKDILDIDMSC